MGSGLSLTTTLIILALSVGGAGVLVWLEKRPVQFGRVRLLPTTPLLFVAILIAIVMLVHLVSLYGGETGLR